MRPAGKPGRAHVSYQVALADAFAGADAAGVAGQVSVSGLITPAVPQDHQFPVAAFPAGEGDRAVGHGRHGRAGRGGVIYPLVRPEIFQHGVETAVGKVGGDAPVMQRGAQEHAAQGLAGLVVIIILPDRGGLSARLGPFVGGRRDLLGDHAACRVPAVIPRQRPLVPVADFGKEIHRPGEYVGVIQDHGRRHPARGHGLPERGFYRAGGFRAGGLDLHRAHRQREPGGGGEQEIILQPLRYEEILGRPPR